MVQARSMEPEYAAASPQSFTPLSFQSSAIDGERQDALCPPKKRPVLMRLFPLGPDVPRTPYETNHFPPEPTFNHARTIAATHPGEGSGKPSDTYRRGDESPEQQSLATVPLKSFLHGCTPKPNMFPNVHGEAADGEENYPNLALQLTLALTPSKDLEPISFDFSRDSQHPHHDEWGDLESYIDATSPSVDQFKGSASQISLAGNSTYLPILRQPLAPVAQPYPGGSCPITASPLSQRSQGIELTAGLSEDTGLAPHNHELQIGAEVAATGTVIRRFRARHGPQPRSSRFRGVTYYKRTKRWEAHIWCKGRQIYLGASSTAEKAARAYDRAAIHFRTVAAEINFELKDYEKELTLLEKISKDQLITMLRKQSVGIGQPFPTYPSEIQAATCYDGSRGLFAMSRHGGNDGKLPVHGRMENVSTSFSLPAVSTTSGNVITTSVNFPLSFSCSKIVMAGSSASLAHVEPITTCSSPPKRVVHRPQATHVSKRRAEYLELINKI